MPFVDSFEVLGANPAITLVAVHIPPCHQHPASPFFVHNRNGLKPNYPNDPAFATRPLIDRYAIVVYDPNVFRDATAKVVSFDVFNDCRSRISDSIASIWSDGIPRRCDDDLKYPEEQRSNKTYH